jgi:hypothetical protein
MLFELFGEHFVLKLSRKSRKRLSASVSNDLKLALVGKEVTPTEECLHLGRAIGEEVLMEDRLNDTDNDSVPIFTT